LSFGYLTIHFIARLSRPLSALQWFSSLRWRNESWAGRSSSEWCLWIQCLSEPLKKRPAHRNVRKAEDYWGIHPDKPGLVLEEKAY